ncbi:hypothetical protein ACFVX6_25765 [Streptomyces sp. NPDC058289]|uniref:hypothetical protein n=1 Tax=Streptomyces sp. NPDC058289 TaxID=3346425 RepID=UPI0036E62DF1
MQARLKDIHTATAVPVGELRVEIPGELLDELCTVVAVGLGPERRWHRPGGGAVQADRSSS